MHVTAQTSFYATFFNEIQALSLMAVIEGHGHQEINEIALQRKKKGSQITSVKSSEGKEVVDIPFQLSTITKYRRFK